MKNIPFNKPFLTGNELNYIKDAVESGKISGNGKFTKLCHELFENTFNVNKTLLTSSCTDALEMSAMLANIEENDEVIIPSFTFVSTALAFIREKATIVFADSNKNNPNIDADLIEGLITPRTKAIVPVHYAGIACDMDKIMNLAEKHNLVVIEDAAQAIDSYYKGKALGTIGDLGCFSFHETKNIISGEGGLLAINNQNYTKRSEVLWEKGTNRSEFFRGEVNKYGWIDTGSSFLPSEIIAAFLYAQFENLQSIQNKRKKLWDQYHNNLKELQNEGHLELPFIPDYATNNAHMFYIICKNLDERSALISHLKEKNILSVFHYLSLHKSDYYADKYKGNELNNSDHYTDCLLRLPLFYELTESEVDYITESISKFYKK
ncbi:dTDP-4-amino-4,6-dideoxygalactose transaminase [Chryseobacterium chendengshani]|uniref:dTDP-4-amino-4,6-dideoxygalactose transaminase n=1 Tax=Chryseobacterium sp. LJ756 TaxID=2864113 RepID=UPI001C640002|nr:dTDP-4-amino-4,6-dideoxygalactose transaminase [Chryseobacterium sp. LJ756]MBW7676619.1 dTDP-4-amino-4,6-dideoxygalactose transaminase [Chryseobacterium sp. LJ756]